MDEKTIKIRLKSIKAAMRQTKIDALVVTVPQNVTYLTGFSGHDSWVVVIGPKITFLTDSRYTEQAQKQCFGCRIIERKEEMAKAVGKLTARTKSVKIVGVEERALLGDFGRLKNQIKAKVKSVAGIVETVRRTKDPSEVRAIRTAAKVAWKALDRALKKLRAGMSESEFAGLLEYEMRKLNSQPSFETIAAFGANGSLPHYQPGKRKLRKNDTILIDFGAKYKSYCSDITRCFAVGEIKGFYEKVYYAVTEAQRAAIKTVRDGIKVSQVDSAAREVLAKYDLPVYGHGTGHGLGLEVHETPTVTKDIKGVLITGDVVTIEPGVYIPGKLGIRIEDDILVTKAGCKILSDLKGFKCSPKNLPVLKSR